jgi:hypothetical protein
MGRQLTGWFGPPVMKIGTPSWWLPPQPPAGSKVPLPATIAPVDINSPRTWPFTPPARRMASTLPARPPAVRGRSSRVANPGKETPLSATILYMSISLDGFVAGPNAGPGNGLGDGRERLHDWFMTGGSTDLPHRRTGYLRCSARRP